jgi:cytosine/adenosine deaminase-related metal-dependent hydrolase
LETGKRADVVLVDTSGIEFHPGRQPVSALVYSGTGKNVDTVIIDGQIIMRNRTMLTVDEEMIKGDLAKASIDWRERTGVSMPPPWPVA